MQPINILIFLILFPLFVAFCSLVIRPGLVRRLTLAAANLMIASGSAALLLATGPDPVFFSIDQPALDYFISGSLVAFALLITYLAVRSRRYLTASLGAILTVATVIFELMSPPTIAAGRELFIDRFSVMMALIVGILGPLITYYAIGYLAEQQERHPGDEDRRPFFGFLIYLFISAMFGLVFSNSLRWLLFFWEITTLCSFFLIKYKEDQESRDAAFRALWMNVVGGISFSFGIFYMGRLGFFELDRVIISGLPELLVPAVFLAFAGIVKSAQMPFSPWLTKAMVAPTPVSALLHSSTMVKAGVYVLLRVSPILYDTTAGVSVTFVGAVTFLFASLIAVSQSDAKRVLAYSTISTLGLIVMCAGIGTYEAAWSALLLIVFHAVAKSLLFLCVGVVDLRLGSRDIEDMDFLVMKMPRLSVMMNIGLAGMFLAPFGMVISKAVTLRALVDTHPVLGVILAFGSGATLFFYAKWMGKVLMIRSGERNREREITPWEWLALVILSALTIAVCLLFPAISHNLIDPYVLWAYGIPPTVEPFNLFMIVVIMVSLLVIFPLGLAYSVLRKRYRFVGVYLSGLNVSKSTFRGASGEILRVDSRNYYLKSMFGEMRLLPVGLLAAGFCLIVMFGVVIL
jgi:ech hydrogenase subunit A